MNKIKHLKIEKRLSYGDIAKESGLSATYIYLLAEGKRKNPSLSVMKSIARVLKENVEKVFQVN